MNKVSRKAVIVNSRPARRIGANVRKGDTGTVVSLPYLDGDVWFMADNDRAGSPDMPWIIPEKSLKYLDEEEK
jgi:hypothetical protein